MARTNKKLSSISHGISFWIILNQATVRRCCITWWVWLILCISRMRWGWLRCLKLLWRLLCRLLTGCLVNLGILILFLWYRLLLNIHNISMRSIRKLGDNRRWRGYLLKLLKKFSPELSKLETNLWLWRNFCNIFPTKEDQFNNSSKLS